MATYTIEAILKATGVDKFQKAIAGAQESLKGVEKASQKMKDVGSTLTKNLTVPIVAIGTLSSKAAADFESSMAGVAKTTDFVGNEFDDMRDSILEMTRRIPASANEIAEVAEAAGQLGIEKQNILDFSEVMINLGVATNLGAEDAATSLARLANITGMSQTDFDKLGSTIVDLGNNLATTEAEIVDMGLRLAGTSSQIGLTEAQILGLAGAMSSVGISAEAGGTAMSTVMQKINTSVLSGSDDMNGFAKVAGMSSKEFAKAWESDPQVAITSFVEGLGKMNADGVDTVTMLKDLGIAGIREIDTLNRLSGATGLLADSFGTASNAWAENTALTEEAETAYQTTANQIQLAKNAIIEAGIALGEHLLPYVAQLAEWVAGLAQRFAELNPNIQIIILAVGAFLALLGPLLMIIGQIGLGISALGGVLAAIFSPIGLVITAIIALVAVLTYLYNTNETVRDGIQQVWTAIKSIITTVLNAIMAVMKAIWPAILAVVKFAWDGIKNVIEGTLKVITGIIDFFKALFTGNWSALWSAVKQIVTGAVQAIWGLIQLWIVGKIIGAVKAFAVAFKGVFTSLWSGVKGIFTKGLQGALKVVTNFFGKFVTAGGNIVGSIAKGITGAIGKVTKAIGGVVSKVRNFLPFSPAKEGPLQDIDKLNFGGTIADSIYKGENEIQRAMGRTLDIGAINGNVTHEINSGSSQPAHINLNLGRQNFKGFVEDITNAQDKNVNLELSYL